MLTGRAVSEPYDEIEIESPDDVIIPMQQIRIRPGGEWHRRGAVPVETACGIVFAASGVREYELEGELCSQCFTDRERFLAAHPELLQGDRK
jgi:hypothetical protein